MDAPPQIELNVALLAESSQRNQFRTFLQDRGVRIVRDESFPTEEFSRTDNRADVMLVGLGEQFDQAAVLRLLDQVQTPVLLNQGGVNCSQLWQQGLMDKLYQLAGQETVIQHGNTPKAGRPELHIFEKKDVSSVYAGVHLVVLGASIGGPKAVSGFLGALAGDLPVTFLLAQHIGSSYRHLLAEQLNRCSSWTVSLLQDEHQMLPGQVWLVPPDQQIALLPKGKIRLRDQRWDSAYRPCISSVLNLVAQTYGTRSGAIMFSGLGSDGSAGCVTISQHGGFVWTQESKSCVNPKLPEAVSNRNRVEYSGTPEELAEALSQKYQAQVTVLN